jgi:regulator of protease activity HflC (stomatin/prohibitin superfamily)
MKRAMARQAEAEREKRAKIINAEGESAPRTPPGTLDGAGRPALQTRWCC